MLLLGVSAQHRSRALPGAALYSHPWASHPVAVTFRGITIARTHPRIAPRFAVSDLPPLLGPTAASHRRAVCALLRTGTSTSRSASRARTSTSTAGCARDRCGSRSTTISRSRSRRCAASSSEPRARMRRGGHMLAAVDKAARQRRLGRSCSISRHARARGEQRTAGECPCAFQSYSTRPASMPAWTAAPSYNSEGGLRRRCCRVQLTQQTPGLLV